MLRTTSWELKLAPVIICLLPKFCEGILHFATLSVLRVLNIVREIPNFYINLGSRCLLLSAAFRNNGLNVVYITTLCELLNNFVGFTFIFLKFQDCWMISAKTNGIILFSLLFVILVLQVNL